MDIIFYTETTTDRKTYSYCSNGELTSDVKVIESCDWKFEKKFNCPDSDYFRENAWEELTREEEVKFYKRALETTIL